MKRIYLIDCPGVVPPSSAATDEDILLRGVVRVERVEHPAQYMDAVLRRCRPRHVELTYEVSGYKDANDFLDMVARKRGRLLKGGEPDLDGVAKMVISDFLRGKLPWCTLPPESDAPAGEADADTTELDLDALPAGDADKAADENAEPEEGDGEDSDFEGFED